MNLTNEINKGLHDICFKHALGSAGGIFTEVELEYNTYAHGKGIETKSEKIKVINDFESFINSYAAKYKQLGGQETDEVLFVITGCAIRGEKLRHTNHQLEYPLEKCIFHNCIITVAKHISPNNPIFEMKAHTLDGCDVKMPPKQHDDFTLRVQNITNCVFTYPRGCAIRGIKSKISDSYFGGSLNLESSDYEFEKCEFKSYMGGGASKIIFTDCVVGMLNAGLLKQLIATKTTFGKFNLGHKEALSAATILSDVTFETPPQFPEEFTKRNVSFKNLTFKDMHSDEALASFRSLKYLCEKAGYEHGVIMFHGLELETHYNVYFKNKWRFDDLADKALYYLHKIFTDYGRNTIRPMLVIIYLLLAGFTVNRWVADIKNSFLCSFYNSVGPAALALNNKKLCDGIEGFYISQWHFFQFTSASIIWFVLIFMARRRFKI